MEKNFLKFYGEERTTTGSKISTKNNNQMVPECAFWYLGYKSRMLATTSLNRVFTATVPLMSY